MKQVRVVLTEGHVTSGLMIALCVCLVAQDEYVAEGPGVPRSHYCDVLKSASLVKLPRVGCEVVLWLPGLDESGRFLPPGSRAQG